VTKIEAADGTAQQIPPDASTPLWLTLPAGTYKITLAGPPPDLESRIVTVQVEANGTATLNAERFRTMTPEEYFEQYLSSSASAPLDGTAPAAGDPSAAPSNQPATPNAATAPQGAQQ
jgi:hypothetical protein